VIIGLATASMPPKKTMSGFLALIAVRMAVKSVALSVELGVLIAPPEA
jgi:hypothetical protein